MRNEERNEITGNMIISRKREYEISRNKMELMKKLLFLRIEPARNARTRYIAKAAIKRIYIKEYLRTNSIQDKRVKKYMPQERFFAIQLDEIDRPAHGCNLLLKNYPGWNLFCSGVIRESITMDKKYPYPYEKKKSNCKLFA